MNLVSAFDKRPPTAAAVYQPSLFGRKGRLAARPAFSAPVLAILLLCFFAGTTTSAAADKTFLLGASSIQLQDVSSEVAVYFQSMRFNRAAGVWNVETILTNTGPRTLRTPLILSIETFSNTTGPIQPDGIDAGPPPKPFYDLSSQQPNGILAPGTSTRARTLTLGRSTGAPRLTAKVYSLPPTQFKAVSVARSLDAVGHPLAEVDVIERGPQGERTIRTDVHLGLATLGQGDGAYTWKFSREGYLPVWRQRVLAANEVGVLISPRLTERDTNRVALTSLDGGQVSSLNESIQIAFTTGAFQRNVTGTLTPLTPSALPALLPSGWSPMQAFWLELGGEPSRAGNVRLIPWGPISSNEHAGLVRWSESSLRWEVLQLVNGNGTNTVEVAIAGSGAYALVIGDTGSTAPPAPQIGQPLAGSSIAFSDYSTLSAAGKVEPSVRPASPVAALVTAQAEVTFTNSAGALPSGLVLNCEISETYDLQDGTRRTPPRYENFIVGYQRPGDGSATTLHSRFPLRPLWLFGAEELAEAIIKVDVLAPAPFTGGILDGTGGQVALEGIRLLAGAGDILGTQAVQIQGLAPTNFTSLGVSPTNVATAFELTVTGVAEDRRLTAQFATQAPNSHFVLARVSSDGGVYGLEPVERFASDAGGNATSTEPASGDRLAGITGGGQYLLVKVVSAQSLLTGVARNAQGLPARDVVVRVSDQPWLTVSGADGRYRLVAPAGQVKLSTTDLTSGDTGQVDLAVADPARPTTVDLRTIPAGPTVISINPTNGAVAVSRVTPIVLTFSEPLNAGTLSAAAVQLIDAQNQPVVASVTLNARNTIITVLPTNSLAANTRHTVQLLPGITDLTGLPLQGSSSFSFTTATDNLNRPRGAQVISHEPEDGIARMEGTQGIADPESPVILVNDTTGQTSTTLAKVDGSFRGEIAASVDDRLRAVFVNQNGTRTEMPVGRQLFPDGSVALFSGGGTLTNANEELRIVMEVPPGAIPGRTKFSVEPLKVSDLPSVTSNTPPENATVFGLFNLKVEGDPLRAPAKFTFRPDLSKLVPPPGKSVTDFVLLASAPRVFNEIGPDGRTNIVAYEILGQLRPDTPTNQAGLASARPHNFVAFYSVLIDPVNAMVGLFGTVQYTKTEIFGKVQSAFFRGGKEVIQGTEIPLGGAVVRARAGLENQRAFTLQPGEAFTVSDETGHFVFLVPTQFTPGAQLPIASGGHVLIASHPSFPRQFASSAGLRFDPNHPYGGGVITFDRQLPPDTGPPSLVVTHVPPLPRIQDRAVVRVEATDDSGPPTPQLSVDAVDPPSAVALLVPQGPGFWTLECTAPAKVTLKARAQDGFGNARELVYAILFGQKPPSPPSVNDPSGPYVVFSQPDSDAVGISTVTAIALQFNEPVDLDIMANPATYLTLSPSAGRPRAEFGRDQREVLVRYTGLLNGLDYTLTLQALRDLTGQILDQNPATNSPPAEPFVLRFRTAAEGHQPLPGIDDGKGVVMRGAYAYVIDRAQSTLDQFDLSIPSQPVLVAQRFLTGPPWSLALIPNYSYAREYAGGIGNPAPPPEPLRSDLLAVAGKVSSQTHTYLRIYDLSQSLETNAHIAGAIFALDGTALITRLAWSAPYLIAVENNLSAPAIHVLNLQALLLSDSYLKLTRQQLLELPPENAPGIDLNSDGDFVDPGEKLPLLGRESIDFTAGEVDLFSLTPNSLGPNGGLQYLVSSSRFINDVVVDGTSGFIGALIAPGQEVIVEALATPIATNRLSRPAEFRSFVVGQTTPAAGGYHVEFPGWQPKRALLVTVGLQKLALLNLISLDNGTNSLRVLEVTRPDSLFEISDIPFSVAEYGLLQGATVDEHGTIVLSTARADGEHFVLLDPQKLGYPTPLIGPHPAIIGIVAGAGGGPIPFASRRYGTSVVSSRNRNVVTQTSPFLRLVGVGSNWFNAFGPASLADRLDEIQSLPDLETLSVARHGTNSNLIPPDPKFHWQLLFEAPGGAGRDINLAVMSVDSKGNVLPRTNNMPPSSALPAVPLRRLSDDLSSAAFNVYLSRPLVLTDANIDGNEMVRINAVLDRHVLFAGHRIRVGIPESQRANLVLGSFAGVGIVTSTPTSNAPPVRLGVSVARPVIGNINPQLTADDPVVIQTRVDSLNGTSCPGSAWLNYWHNLDCKISIRIDGQPASNVYDENGNLVTTFTDVASQAGSHRILIDAAHVPSPGDHPFEVTGTAFDGQPPNVTLTAPGTIQHEIEIQHSFPIGHTVIEGVDIWDGHLSHSHQDVAIPGRRLSLDFTRSYSSQGNSREGPVGAGWTHSYNCRLVQQCGVFTVVGGEGSGNSFIDPRANPAKAILFQRLLPPALNPADLDFFKPQIGYHSNLVRDRNRADQAWFFSKTGIRYHFVTEPKLSSSSATVYTLREIREPNGNALEFNYLSGDPDPATLDAVTEIDRTGARKRGFRFEYRNIPTVPRIVGLRGFNEQTGSDLYGLEIQYNYDGWGNLTNVVRLGNSPSDTRTQSYVYTAGDGPTGHNLIEYTEPNGAITRYTYNTPAANPPANYYASGPNLLPGLPPHEIVTNVTHIGAARVGFAATANVSIGFRYDFSNFLRYVGDPRPADSDGNLIPETEYKLNIYGATTRVKAPLGQETEMHWATDHRDGSVLDENGQPVNDVLMTYRKDPEGQEQFFEFKDGRGNLTRERTVFTGSTKKPVTDATGNPRNEIEMTYTFHPLFNERELTTDAEGKPTRYEVDANTGNLMKTVDARGYETEFTYYPNGDVRTRIDPRRFVTRFLRYDPYGNAELVEDPLGNQTETSFDERSRQLETSDTFKHHSRFGYDGLDRRLLEARLNDLSGLSTGPGATNLTSYLPGGQPNFKTNALGLVSQHFYDALNRAVRSVLLAVRQGNGPAQDYETRVAYDRSGNLIEETDARGVIRTHAYDALNRRIRTTVSGPYGGPFNGNGVVARLSYDRANNLTNEVDMHRFATSHEHDALYRIVESHLPFPGAVIRTRYDRAGNKTRTTDANGNATLLEYDDLYRLTRTTDAENNIVEFQYDAANNRTNTHNLSSGLVTAVSFDAGNRELDRTHSGPGLPGSGYTTQTRYGDALNQITVTNPRGYKMRTRRDGLDRTAETVVDDGNLNLTSRFTYDAAGNLLTWQDPQNGDTDVTHEYDQVSRRLRTILVLGGGETNQPTELFTYDPVGNITNAVDRRGFERAASFDNLSRQLTTALKETISNGGAWLTLSTTDYDDAANTVATTDARGQPSRTERDELRRPVRVTDALSQETTMTYDGVNLRSQTDRKRQRTEFTYDRLNRLQRADEFDVSGQLQTSTATEYLDTQRRQRVTDRRGLKTTTEFDALGRAIRTERSGGDLAARYGSDPLLLESRDYDANSNRSRITDGNGHTTEYSYDGADRLTNVVDGASSPVAGATSFKLDPVGNVLEVKDARAHGSTFDSQFTYDARYRRLSSANSLGETTRYRYDPGNNLVELTEPLGYVTRYEYDELNALLAVDETLRLTAADAGVTRFRYDANRNKLAQQDPNTNLVTYAYDALNRLTNTLQHTAPGTLMAGGNRTGSFGGGGALSWSFDYDPNNNHRIITDARDQRVELTYDHLNRLTNRAYSNHAETTPAGTPIDFQPVAIRYEYDGNTNPTNCFEVKQLGAITTTERTEMKFDALDRLIAKTRFDHDDPIGRRIEFAYDVVGNRTNVVDPDGRVTAYTFDERNRIGTATLDPGPSALQAHYTWELDSLLKQVDLPSGSFALRTYDRADRILSITNAHTSGTIFSTYRYVYDLNGNRTNQTELQPALAAAAESTTYNYDKLNRLTRVAYGVVGAANYTYSPNGNRLTEKGTDPVTGAALDRVFHYSQQAARPATTFSGVNALTRIEDKTAAAAHIDYEYDRNLNQIARIQGNNPRTFRFDIRDQMVATTTASSAARFDYNCDRMRVKKLTGANEVRYLYDQASVLIEYGAAAAGHATQQKYDYGYELLALGIAGVGPALDRRFYLTDALMSTANLVGPTGTLTNSYRHDAWGRLRAKTGSDDNRRQYTGHYRDQETGLHYFGARYYDEEQGRFLSQDPYLGAANTPPSLHRYLYAYANPLGFVDLTGYAAESPPQTAAEADKWLKEVQQEAKERDARFKQHVEAVTPGGIAIMEKGAQAAIELQRMNEERARMLKESGLSEADLKNPVMADRAKWGMALLKRDLEKFTVEGDGGTWRAVVAGVAYATASVITAPLELGAAAGTVAGKVDVGAEVTAGEWIGAVGDVLTVAGGAAKLGKIGMSELARGAAERAARGVVIAEARRSIGAAVGDAVRMVDDAPKALAAERQFMQLSRASSQATEALGGARSTSRLAAHSDEVADQLAHAGGHASLPPIRTSADGTVILHQDYLELAHRARRDIASLDDLLSSGKVRRVMAHDDFLGPTARGMFSARTPNLVYVRRGLDAANYNKSLYHELTHAFSFSRRGGSSQTPLERMTGEFFAELRGVQGELVHAGGVGAATKSGTREMLERGGYRGLMENIYERYARQFHTEAVNRGHAIPFIEDLEAALRARGIAVK